MSPGPPGPTRSTDAAVAVELLDRALAYTRGALAGVTDELLTRPTPCRRWDLGALLAHMEDALDAFGEGAAGSVALAPTALAPTALAQARVARLRDKACLLLGAWSAGLPDLVDVGGHRVGVGVIAHTAALEIAVHGWDVAQATGCRTSLPPCLAHDLLPTARVLVDPADRGTRFASALTVPHSASAADRLLAHLGRDPRQIRPR